MKEAGRWIMLPSHVWYHGHFTIARWLI